MTITINNFLKLTLELSENDINSEEYILVNDLTYNNVLNIYFFLNTLITNQNVTIVINQFDEFNTLQQTDTCILNYNDKNLNKNIILTTINTKINITYSFPLNATLIGIFEKKLKDELVINNLDKNPNDVPLKIVHSVNANSIIPLRVQDGTQFEVVNTNQNDFDINDRKVNITNNIIKTNNPSLILDNNTVNINDFKLNINSNTKLIITNPTLQINNTNKIDITNQNLDIDNINLDINDSKIDIIGKILKINDQILDISGEKIDITEEKINISDEIIDISGKVININYEKLDISNQLIDISGQILDITNNKIDINRQILDINNQILDISGKKIDISAGKVNISDENIDISGEILNISNEIINISNERLDISNEIININQKRINISGETIDISGQKIDISGRKIDVNGQRIDISGGKIDINGQRVDISGRKIDISGTRLIADISGQRINISGITVNNINNKVDINNQVLNISSQRINVTNSIFRNIIPEKQILQFNLCGERYGASSRTLGFPIDETYAVNSLVLPSSAQTFIVVSNSTSNNYSTSSGLTQVLIYGIDSNYNLVTEVVNLNGTTNVNTSGSYYCINKIEAYTGSIINGTYVSCKCSGANGSSPITYSALGIAKLTDDQPTTSPYNAAFNYQLLVMCPANYKMCLKSATILNISSNGSDYLLTSAIGQFWVSKYANKQTAGPTPIMWIGKYSTFIRSYKTNTYTFNTGEVLCVSDATSPNGSYAYIHLDFIPL
jgi:hypothetical protein